VYRAPKVKVRLGAALQESCAYHSASVALKRRETYDPCGSTERVLVWL
jgi:hypothetical protein